MMNESHRKQLAPQGPENSDTQHQATVLSRTAKGLGLAGLIIFLLWLEHRLGRGALAEWIPARFLRDGCFALLLENGLLLVVALVLITSPVLREYAAMAAALGAGICVRFTTVAGALLLLYLWAGMVCRYADADTCLFFLHNSGLGAIMFLCMAPMVLLAWKSLKGRLGGGMLSVAAGALALLYAVLPFSFLLALRLRWGVGRLFMVLAVCKLTDVGGYYFGRLIGGPKMAPSVSPNKTWAGVFGGAVLAVAGAMVLQRWTVDFMGLWGGALFGLTMAGVAITGDLAESFMKREAGVKDSGRIIEGYGVVLDMVDDVLFVAPCAYLFLAAAASLQVL